MMPPSKRSRCSDDRVAAQIQRVAQERQLRIGREQREIRARDLGDDRRAHRFPRVLRARAARSARLAWRCGTCPRGRARSDAAMPTRKFDDDRIEARRAAAASRPPRCGCATRRPRGSRSDTGRTARAARWPAPSSMRVIASWRSRLLASASSTSRSSAGSSNSVHQRSSAGALRERRRGQLEHGRRGRRRLAAGDRERNCERRSGIAKRVRHVRSRIRSHAADGRACAARWCAC